jgi:HK97 family phage major capsid protein
MVTDKVKAVSEKIAEAKKIRDAATAEQPLTDEQVAQIKTLSDDVATLKAGIEADEQHTAALATLDATNDWLREPARRVSDPPDPGVSPTADPLRKPQSVIPATVRRYGTVRSFTGPNADEKAYRFGTWCNASAGHQRSIQRCRDLGIRFLAATPHKESDNVHGGYLVPPEFDMDMIKLLETYGVFRRLARIVPMTSDTKMRRRRTGGITVYFVSEGGAGTHSKMTHDMVSLTAKDLMGLSTYTQDLSDDATISVGDELMDEISRAFAQKEDSCGLLGDGTSTYGGIVGIAPALKGLSGTIANISGLIVGAGNAYSELTLLNFNSVVALLPTFADTPRARWIMHKSFFANVPQALITAVGGATPSDWAQGIPPKLLGYPVEFAQVMPKVEGNSQVCALLGDVNLCADFGDRRQTSIQFSTDATVDSVSMFETNQVAIRGTERFDINVHDVGNATATAADKTPGPVVGLITAAS